MCIPQARNFWQILIWLAVAQADCQTTEFNPPPNFQLYIYIVRTASLSYSTGPRYWFWLQTPVTLVTKVAFVGSLAIEADNERLELLYPLGHHLGPLLNLLPGYASMLNPLLTA